MPIPIQPNENLFTAYVGLTASGYDPAKKNDEPVQSLIAEILSLPFAENIIGYFKKARSSNQTNPHRPYGSDISAACHFMKGRSFSTFDDYLSFEKSTGYEGHGPGFRSWISELPEYLERISRVFRSHPDRRCFLIGNGILTF